MRHRVVGRKLGRNSAQRNALLRNLVGELIKRESIITTEPKAREARIQVEKMITLGKKGDLHARRQALAYIYDENIVDKLFHVVAPRYVSRQGGYTQILKLGFRKGDNASLVMLKLVEQ